MPGSRRGTAAAHCGARLPGRRAAVRRCGPAAAASAGSALGPRVWQVAAASAVGGFAVGFRLGNDPVVLTFLAFSLGCVLLAFIDLAVRRLPDQLTAPLAVLGVVGLGTAAYLARDMTPLLRGLTGAALAGGLLPRAGLHPAGRGGHGARRRQAGRRARPVPGLPRLGRPGARASSPGRSSASVFALVMLRTGRMTRKSAMTYGPFLMLGALLAVLVG